MYFMSWFSSEQIKFRVIRPHDQVDVNSWVESFQIDRVKFWALTLVNCLFERATLPSALRKEWKVCRYKKYFNRSYLQLAQVMEVMEEGTFKTA